MPFPSGTTTYTFAGVTFARVVESDEVVPWLYPQPQYTIDTVLGGARTYLDIGASVAPPLSFRASCLSAANRVTLIGAVGTSGTLTNTRGHTATVTLVKAVPVNSAPYAQWLIDLIFELRP